MAAKYNLTKIFSVIAILAMTFSSVKTVHVQAQNGDGLKRQVNAESGRVSFITPADGKPLSAVRALGQSIRPQDPAMALAVKYGPEFGVKDPQRSLAAMDSNRADDGRVTVRFQQNYENVPVMGGELIVNTNDNGDLYSISGEVSPGLTIPTQPTIDAEQARETALQSMAKWYGKTSADFTSTVPELWIYDQSLLEPGTRPAELTWRMEVMPKDGSMPVRELVLINAQRGSISLHFNQIDTAWSASGNSAGSHQDTAPTPEPQAASVPNVEEPAGLQAGELAATLYVAVGGNDGNLCNSALAPCATINGAIDKAANGDTIRIKAGTYTGSGDQVVLINKAVTLLGGWDSSFAAQTGYSTIDGQITRRGIYVNSGTAGLVTIDRFVVTNGYAMNTMTDGGGGITVQWDSKLVLSNSLIYGNQSFAAGGILSSYADLTILNTTISNNRSTSQGGGGLVFGNYGSSKTLIINNATIVGNAARGSGGGIYIYDSGSAGAGGETIRNTIIAFNTATDAADCLTTGGELDTASHNIIASSTGCTMPGGSNTAVDPRITTALVGTPGHHALFKDSPAINAGGSDCQATDQRGVARPQGAACDIGAYEYPATAPVTATALAILNGNNQRTLPNAAFALPLSVVLTNTVGDVVEQSGVPVTLTAPSTGPSLTFAGTGNAASIVTTNSSGVAASTTATANGLSGAYSVSATSGGYTSVNFNLRNAMWFVSTGGNNANSCDTPASPCASVNAVLAKTQFSPGETIRVATGTYTTSAGYIIDITRGVVLSGGWDAGFTAQTGFSTLDGQGSWSGISTQDILANGAVSVDRFIIKNGQTGIYNSNAGQFTLTNSSIHSNTRGGIEHFGPSMVLNNVVISNNVNTSMEGGGIFMGNTSLVMNNVTITGNQAYDGGGIFYSPYYGSGTVSIQMSNTILAGNISNISSAPNCKGPITSLGHNIISDTTGCTVTAGSGDKLNVNPLLGVFLPEYGYQTIQAGSPAINAGSGCYGTTDQRGVTRLDACDIGAYEYRAPGAVSSLSMISGTGQTTAPSLDFKKVLKVAALDATGNPVPGVQVTFTAPGSGASLSFKSSGAGTAAYQTDAAGVASTSVMTANNQIGVYAVSATAAGAANPVNFTLENLAWFVAPTGADTNSCKSPALSMCDHQRCLGKDRKRRSDPGCRRSLYGQRLLHRLCQSKRAALGRLEYNVHGEDRHVHARRPENKKRIGRQQRDRCHD